MKNHFTICFRLLFVVLLMSFISMNDAKANETSLEEMVSEAQELVYSNPRKLDSIIAVIEEVTLAKGDSTYFATIRSLQGIKSSMQNDYGPALKYFYDVWKRSKRIGDTVTQMSALINMSGVSQMSGRYRDAKTKLIAALDLVNPTDDQFKRAKIVMAIGAAEVELNQFDSAVSNFKLAVELFDELEEEHYVLSCMNELGYALESQHKYKDALDIYKRMDVLYRFTQDATGEIVVNQRKGSTLMHLGRMTEAAEALEYSLTLADSMKYENQKDTTLLRLIKANAALGNIAGAEKYTKRLVAFIQAREEQKNQELVAFVETRYNLEEKSRINESLATELRSAREELSRTGLYLRFSIAGIVVLFLSLVVVFKRFGSIDPR